MKNKEDIFGRLQVSGYDARLDALVIGHPFQAKVDHMSALVGGIKLPARSRS